MGDAAKLMTGEDIRLVTQLLEHCEPGDHFWDSLVFSNLLDGFDVPPAAARLRLEVDSVRPGDFPSSEVHVAWEGSEPTASDPIYTAPLPTGAEGEAVVLRARAWEDGLWPSRVGRLLNLPG